MKYHLAEACENTFILFDRLETAVLEEEFLQGAHRCLIEEKEMMR